MCNVNGRILIPCVVCARVCVYTYNASYIYIYIYIAFSVSQIVVSGYQIYCKIHRMKSLYPKLWYRSDICQEVLRKTAKNISRVVSRLKFERRTSQIRVCNVIFSAAQLSNAYSCSKSQPSCQQLLHGILLPPRVVSLCMGLRLRCVAIIVSLCMGLRLRCVAIMHSPFNACRSNTPFSCTFLNCHSYKIL